MARGSAANFLRLMNSQNEAIIAREKEAEAREEAAKPTPDLVRLQRDTERRERLGQLRARPRSRSKTARVRARWDTLGSTE